MSQELITADLETDNKSESSHWRQELRSVMAMSGPIVVTTCCRLLMDVTDFIMISGFGTHAQAAILSVQVVLFCYMAMGMGLVSMTTTFAAQCLGRKEYRQCSAYSWQSLYLSLLIGVAGLGLLWVIPPVLGWIGHEPSVRQLEVDYAMYSIWSIFGTVAAAGLSGFFNGIHRPRITMYSALESLVLNVVLNYCFILGHCGMPRMGVAGAALGTLIATYYRAARLLVTMLIPYYNNTFHARQTWRIDVSKMAALLRVGGPQAAQWMSDVIVWALFINVLVGKAFGTLQLAATNVAWQFMRVSFMPIIGLGMALSSLVGKAIGEGDQEKAVRVTRIAAILSLVYMSVMSLIFLIWRYQLIGLLNHDPAVIQIGAAVMICTAIFNIFDALGITYNNSLRGAGDTFWPSVMFVVSHWLIVIGGGVLMIELFPQMGSLGPWIAASGLIIITSLWLWRRWAGGAWRRIDLFKHERRIEPTPAQDGGFGPAELLVNGELGMAGASES